MLLRVVVMVVLVVLVVVVIVVFMLMLSHALLVFGIQRAGAARPR